VNQVSSKHKIQLSNYSNHLVYHDANIVYGFVSGSKQVYLSVTKIFSRTLSYVLIVPFAVFFRLILMYLKFKINKSIRKDIDNRNDSIDNFESSRTKHAQLCVILKNFSSLSQSSKTDTIPSIAKFAISPLIDIATSLEAWSMDFQHDLDKIDNLNVVQNSKDFKSIPENKLWKTRNQNYSYRF